ncbi:MAG: hypothetical protein WC139_05310, partial [Candidatus Kapaibacterium sp.]
HKNTKKTSYHREHREETQRTTEIKRYFYFKELITTKTQKHQENIISQRAPRRNTENHRD